MQGDPSSLKKIAASDQTSKYRDTKGKTKYCSGDEFDSANELPSNDENNEIIQSIDPAPRTNGAKYERKSLGVD